MRPADFKSISEERDLYYRIDPDGGVTLSGFKQKGILSEVLPDGSKIQGGVTGAGDLFGERLVATTNGVVRYPLRWFDPDADVSLQRLEPDEVQNESWTTWSLSPASPPEEETPPEPVTKSKPAPPTAPAPVPPPTSDPASSKSASTSETIKALREAAEALDLANAEIDRLRAENRKLRLRSR